MNKNPLTLIGAALGLLGLILASTVDYQVQTISFDGITTEYYWGRIIGIAALLIVGGVLIKIGKSRNN